MANIIRDADALDRTRFPIFSNDYLNTKFLTHSSSKELIQVFLQNLPIFDFLTALLSRTISNKTVLKE